MTAKTGDTMKTVNLPIAFIDTNYDVANCSIELNTTYHSFREIHFQATTRNLTNMVITSYCKDSQGTVFNVALSFILIGKWK